MLATDDTDGLAEGGPWPAFADLLSATTLLFLVLFAAIAVPALWRANEADAVATNLRKIRADLDSLSRSNAVRVQPMGDYLLVRIAGDATFSKNNFTLEALQPEGRDILRAFGQALRASGMLANIDQVQVVGHASAEGSDERNWIVSASRAATVSLFLIDSVRLDPCKVTAMGRSRFYPVNARAARDSVARGRSAVTGQDRRIELEIRPLLRGDRDRIARLAQCVAPRDVGAEAGA